jgi:hypothetical protein
VNDGPKVERVDDCIFISVDYGRGKCLRVDWRANDARANLVVANSESYEFWETTLEHAHFEAFARAYLEERGFTVKL